MINLDNSKSNSYRNSNSIRKKNNSELYTRLLTLQHYNYLEKIDKIKTLTRKINFNFFSYKDKISTSIAWKMINKILLLVQRFFNRFKTKAGSSHNLIREDSIFPCEAKLSRARSAWTGNRSYGGENRGTWPAGTSPIGGNLALFSASYLYCVYYSPLCMTTIRDQRRLRERSRESSVLCRVPIGVE